MCGSPCSWAAGRASTTSRSRRPARCSRRSTRTRYEAVTVAIGRDGRWELGRGPREHARAQDRDTAAETLPVPTGGACRATLADVDVVLPILHGPFGEDGTVQGLLELAGRARTSARASRPRRSAWTRTCSRRCMRDSGIPVTRNVTLRARRRDRATRSATRSSSSRRGSARRSGSRRSTTRRSSRAAVELARRHDEKVLVEEFVAGIEVECGVLGNREPPIASLPGEIVAHGSSTSGTTTRRSTTRAGWSSSSRRASRDETVERVQELAVDAFVATRVRGDGARRLLRPRRRRGARQRAEHDPRLHRDERLRASCSRRPASRTPSCSTGSSSSRSSATSAARALRF